MRCPDCGGILVEVSLGGIDRSFRCFTCGGVFINSRVANGLPVDALNNWNRIKVEPGVVKPGNEVCPQDGDKLDIYTGDEVPEDIVVRRCRKCGWWWFPLDSLFRFKPVQAEKVRKVKTLGVMGTLAGIMLPIMALTVIVSGALVRQRVQTNAGAAIANFAATYLGDGRELVTFESSERINTVKLVRSDGRWTDLTVKPENGLYRLEIEGLKEGEAYEINAGGKVYKFQTKL